MLRIKKYCKANTLYPKNQISKKLKLLINYDFYA